LAIALVLIFMNEVG